MANEVTIDIVVNNERAKVPINELNSTLEKLGDKTGLSKTESALSDVGDKAKSTNTDTKDLNSTIEKSGSSASGFDKVKNALTDLKDKITGTKTDTNELTSDVKKTGESGSAFTSLKDKLSSFKDSLTGAKSDTSELNSDVKKTGESGSAFTALKDKLMSFKDSMTSTKTDTGELESDIKKVGDSGSAFTSLKDKVSGLKNEESDTASKTSRLGDIIKGSFIGSALTSGVQSLWNNLKEVTTQSTELAESAEKNAAVWKNLGVSGAGVKGLTDQVDSLRKETGLSEDNVTALQKKFYSLTGSVSSAETLTKGVAALGDTLRLSGDQTTTLGSTLDKVAQSGTMTTANLERMEKQAPGIGAALAKAAGMSTTAFTSMVGSGKMTSAQLESLLGKISNNSSSTFSSFGKTTEGAMDKLKGEWTETEQKLAKPLVTIAASGLGAIATLLGSKIIQNGLQAIGKGVADLAKDLTNAVDYMSKYSGTFNKAFGIIGTTVGTVVSLIKSVWSGLFKTLKPIDMGSKINVKDINKALDGINTDIQKFGKQAQPAFKAFGEVLGDVFNALMKLGKPILEIAKDIGKMYLTSFVDELKSLSKYMTPVYDNIKSIADMLAKYLQPYLDALAKWFSKQMPYFASISKSVGAIIGKSLEIITAAIKVLIMAAIGILATFKSTFKAIGPVFSSLEKTIENAYKVIDDLLSLFIDFFTGHWSKLGSDLKKIWSALWKVIEGIASTAWNIIKVGIQAFADVFKLLWNGIALIFKGDWNVMKADGKTAWDWISSAMGSVFNAIGRTFKNIWNGIASFFKGIWDGIKSVGKSAWDWVGNKLGGALKSIGNNWKSMWNGVESFFSGIWKSIKKDAKNGINDVIGVINDGIGGIDDVIHDFGGSKTAIKKIPKFANGTGGAPKGLAVVNDGGGQEAIIDKKGKTHVLPGKNQLVNFEGGETVVPYQASKEMFGNQINHFAGGTDDWLKSVGTWFKDKWDELKDFIKNPLKDVGEVMTKGISGALGGTSNLVGSLAPSLGSGFVKGIISPITKMFKSLLSNEDSNPSGTSVMRWKDDVKKALEMNNLPTSESYVNAWLKQIQTESSGNPNAVQGDIGDVNNATGDLAKGLVQTISTTFEKFHFSGYDNIFKGLDDLLAGIAYAKAKYGASGMLDVIGKGHGYADGGWVEGQNTFLTNDGGYQEMVLSTDPSKKTHTMALLKDFLSKFNGTSAENAVDANLSQSGNSVANSTSSNSSVTYQNIELKNVTWNNKQDPVKMFKDLAVVNTRQTRGKLA
ncbi:putative tape measure protein [Oenococcus phage vB_OeS_unk162]|nr:putative tape measure protein [Oenococcus phage vB_OeS_unk162]